MLEVYNESVRDLLAPPGPGAGRTLELRNTQASGANVPGATQLEVECPEARRGGAAGGGSWVGGRTRGVGHQRSVPLSSAPSRKPSSSRSNPLSSKPPTHTTNPPGRTSSA